MRVVVNELSALTQKTGIGHYTSELLRALRARAEDDRIDRFPTVATVHDLSVLLHPQWHPADRVAYFEKHFPAVVKRCVHFLTDSEFSRQEMIRTLGLDPARVTRVALGIRRGIRPLPPADLA